MKKRMLADVLWDAANEHLAPSRSGCDELGVPDLRFSCNSVSRALGMEAESHYDDWFPLSSSVQGFLEDLGCDCAAESLFKHFRPGEEQQGARYLWLLLAMHVAEDEGVTL